VKSGRDKMKVSTPTISWHNRERVSSVDFQPVAHPRPTSGAAPGSGFDCRMATAGDDKHVVIWELTVDESGKMEPGCLCDLNRHQNSVNVVRWSTNGKLLASGDTDSTIYIWQYDEKEAAPDIFSEEECIRRENWCVMKCLRGHLQDVVGIAWSPDSNFLFSCSTDGTAIVFDVKKGTKVKILSDHNGWVNGVAWDPLNKHVATIASDRCLRLFGTKSYNYVRKVRSCKLVAPSRGNKRVDGGSSKQETPTKNEANEEKNVRLFHDDTFQSFYRRLDYSPDGELLAIPPSGVLEQAAEYGSGNSGSSSGDGKTSHCTHIFSRTNYAKPAVSLPGKDFSICVRFSPIKYTLRPVPRSKSEAAVDEVKANGSPPQAAAEQAVQEKAWEKYETLFALPYRMVYAVVTQNSVTLYDTQQPEPFAQVSKIHYLGLNDVAWSPDGNSLIVASSDGFCSVVNFKEGEIGNVYDENSYATNVASASPVVAMVTDNCESPPKPTSKEGIELNREGVASPSEIKIRSVKEGGKANPKRLQLITLSSPNNKKESPDEELHQQHSQNGESPKATGAKKRALLMPVDNGSKAEASSDLQTKGHSVTGEAEKPRLEAECSTKADSPMASAAKKRVLLMPANEVSKAEASSDLEKEGNSVSSEAEQSRKEAQCSMKADSSKASGAKKRVLLMPADQVSKTKTSSDPEKQDNSVSKKEQPTKEAECSPKANSPKAAGAKKRVLLMPADDASKAKASNGLQKEGNSVDGSEADQPTVEAAAKPIPEAKKEVVAEKETPSASAQPTTPEPKKRAQLITLK